MRYFCGIDIGASATKLVILDEERRAVAGGRGRPYLESRVRRGGISAAST